MADFPVDISAHYVLQFLQRSKARDKDYIKQGKDLVDTFGDRTLALSNPANVKWMICGLQGTSYFNRKEVVEGWGKFYLPDEVRMQVVGLVKRTSCPCEQLVLMICEDGKLYAYDEEELHEVASSLAQLCTQGLQYPSSLCYYKGETFSKMTYEDWEKVKQSDLGKSLDKAHYELVTANKKGFLEKLRREPVLKDRQKTSLGLLDGEASYALKPPTSPLPPPTKQRLFYKLPLDA
ncbi:uncharacterized protein LOC132991327 isoform X2 [Labrus mixtus]|uniref:uncharacterized protein LOC132991327 isoform X2 n=1 Tax=Labrus mixtus TaxID=508554 RepID=UPI0029C0B405|nr:uncharacterized protein LOC132991327 isoform X2 [Labrus mixtus]